MLPKSSVGTPLATSLRHFFSQPFRMAPFWFHFVPFWLPLGAFWLLFGAIWFTFAHSRGLFSHFGISPSNFLYLIILPTQVLQTSRIFVQVVHSAVAGLRLCRAKDNNSTTKNLQGPPRTNTEQGTQTKIENSKHDTTFHIIPPTAKKRIPRNGTCTKRGAAVSRRMASSIIFFASSRGIILIQ